jgi:hypothetical protein
MSLSGRVGVDVLVHQTPSTNSFRIHSLEGSQNISGGKIQTVTGTVGSQWLTLPYQNIPDPDYPGATITFATISRVAMKASDFCECQDQDNDFTICAGPEGGVSSHHSAVAKDIKIKAVQGTASYQVVVIGT